jgi:hypothetical protein
MLDDSERRLHVRREVIKLIRDLPGFDGSLDLQTCSSPTKHLSSLAPSTTSRANPPRRFSWSSSHGMD